MEKQAIHLDYTLWHTLRTARDAVNNVCNYVQQHYSNKDFIAYRKVYYAYQEAQDKVDELIKVTEELIMKANKEDE